MSIKSSIKKQLKKSAMGEIVFFYIRILREKLCMLTPDKEFLEKRYRQNYGKEMNLVEPKNYSEVCTWLKLFYRDKRMTLCADKYGIRDYLAQLGYDDLCNEVIGVYDDARKIDFDSLPDKFVAKATHGSGWNLVCKDKSKLDWKKEVKKMNMWLKLDLTAFGREWNYKDIKPQIVVEKFIDHEPLNDYKFMCFNGEPMFMQLNNDFDGKHYVDYFRLENWEKLPVSIKGYTSSNREIKKPDNYDKMFELAKKLSEPFPFARIDFYSFDETIILGEITFFTGGGITPFISEEGDYDELFGSLIKLPKPNHNLDLYNKLYNKN